MMKIDRGDIVKIDFDPSMGGEIKGSRPALVLSSKSFHQTGFMMLCPISQGEAATARENGFSVSLMGSGCKTNGVVIAHQVRVVDFRVRKIRKFETTPTFIVDEVQDIVEAILRD
ncbi:type II toxin-antitoxin system PemK/MazF family toxin [Testudinibacter sp. TR-2022]|uniref:type II toxin-antitoxin system PemK/MazF family toxin n=1 Tax=Testudinibacter sp. TR-2022 TaxID=2585029 RepID=UPI00111AE26F|nr:type II toxin-antitoxin system PemK/MazF family toxin [Testudinibacter sp. TR-2022]TNH04890.1 growth inhibitor PemK [Pasteurellaceae bacterium Phil11]TNH24101.1 growth inhibitor PemK [Testudinibacter sp. TR-2022]TNH24354.1 growth inhibitor PemK [Testudinibacter sp. TR-2022]